MQADDILIVEDDRYLREDMVELFQQDGYAVTQAADGAEALRSLTFTAYRPCVILLDLMMPVMNGWNFRALQLTDLALAAIPVVIVTGVADAKLEAQTLAVGGYVKKPFDIDALLIEVRRHCRCSLHA